MPWRCWVMSLLCFALPLHTFVFLVLFLFLESFAPDLLLFCCLTFWLGSSSHCFLYSVFNEQSMAQASVPSFMWSVQSEAAGEWTHTDTDTQTYTLWNTCASSLSIWLGQHVRKTLVIRQRLSVQPKFVNHVDGKILTRLFLIVCVDVAVTNNSLMRSSLTHTYICVILLGVYALYCGQPPGGDPDCLDSLLGNRHFNPSIYTIYRAQLYLKLINTYTGLDAVYYTSYFSILAC